MTIVTSAVFFAIIICAAWWYADRCDRREAQQILSAKTRGAVGRTLRGLAGSAGGALGPTGASPIVASPRPFDWETDLSGAQILEGPGFTGWD